jgi:23S rRNA (uracil1939-C5)-methyltransferase
MLEDSLKRIGKIDLQQEIEIFPSPEQLEYRSRAVWHLDPREKTLGYFKRGSHDVVDIENCPIITPDLNRTLHDLRHNIDWASFSGLRVAIEAASAGGEISVYSNELIEPTNEIEYASGGEKYKYNARSFFQANQYLIGELVTAVVGGTEGRCAFDLYCGVGLFTIPLARKFKRVFGVEGNLDAVEFARSNAVTAEIENINFIAESVDGFLNSATGDELDLIVLDPPRSGTEKGTIHRIIELSPAAISFVACDPSVLARDLNLLLAGGYQIDSIKLFDLFPQTHHIETVVRLSRRS